MKQKLLLMSLVLICNILFSQNHKMVYTMKYKRDSTNEQLVKKNMVLLVEKDKTLFISENQFEHDSIKINSNDKSSQRIYDYDFMILEDKSKEKTEHFFSLLTDLYSLKDKTVKLQWIPTNVTKKIYHYNTRKATLKYSGREWEAWFAEEIPINEGSHIFRGLPGLIIEIKDTQNNYIFELVSIAKIENISIDKLIPNNIAVTREQFKKVKLNYYNDPYSDARLGKMKVCWVDENGKEFTPNYRELTLEEQRNIRKYNNPIELSNAIVYPEK